MGEWHSWELLPPAERERHRIAEERASELERLADRLEQRLERTRALLRELQGRRQFAGKRSDDLTRELIDAHRRVGRVVEAIRHEVFAVRQAAWLGESSGVQPGIYGPPAG